MNLTIDAGNTNVKYALFEGGKILDTGVLSGDRHIEDLDMLIKKHRVKKAIMSSVRKSSDDFISMLTTEIPVIRLSSALTLPFTIAYETPETLGNDRIANAAGALKLSSSENLLIVDCGTCITYTFIHKKQLIGGTIAPGIRMRFKALHQFTGNLPEITDATSPVEIPGRNTRNSIVSGVLNAIIAETETMIGAYCSSSDGINVILTGGDRPFFEKHLKSPIFAVPFLTHEGLHEILLLNS